ncbi:MAG: hydroxymethylpyrimidine/phosphomethylpyrimidine kinase [Gammaproteobacteria bacterium]
MNTGTHTIPVVLTFAGHDPSGGAGLQADIEAVASQGCHAATVVTALTVQDTQDVAGFISVESTLVIAQARSILEDMPVAVFKIGMLGSIENAEAVHTILMDYPEIPVVFDPVLASGHGTDLGGQELIEVLQALLLPVTTILTPNGPEARALAPGADTLDACAFALLEHDVDYVLVTGSHEHTPAVINRLYSGQRLLETFTWERLPHSYHGSGCTLAASIAGLLAQGLEPFTAIQEAQDYTWNTLRQGYRPGLGQHLPHRFFWSVDDED